MQKQIESQEQSVPNAQQRVSISKDQLPVHCPMPGSSLWNSHPRVYIPLKEAANGKAICPYCGTQFVLE